MEVELSFYRHLEMTALLAELILGYSRGFNSRPLLTDHDRISRGLYQGMDRARLGLSV
jgi:hypothetical protein